LAGENRKRNGELHREKGSIALFVEPVKKCVHAEFTRENMLLAAFIRQG